MLLVARLDPVLSHRCDHRSRTFGALKRRKTQPHLVFAGTRGGSLRSRSGRRSRTLMTIVGGARLGSPDMNSGMDRAEIDLDALPSS
jgi:hypothetical protein